MLFRFTELPWLKLVPLAAATLPSVCALAATPQELGMARVDVNFPDTGFTKHYRVPFDDKDSLAEQIANINIYTRRAHPDTRFLWSCEIKRDPSVAYNASITNPTSDPGLVAATLDFPINPLMLNTAFGELVVELIDENGDGEAFLTATLPGGGLQEAYVRNSTTLDGVPVGLPLGANVTAPGTHVFSLPSMAGPTPADGDQIVVSTSFLLSPGDTVRLRSQFVIDEGTGIPVAEIPPLPNPDDGPYFNVIDVPDTMIGDDELIGSQTQLNVYDGGSLGERFQAGSDIYFNFDTQVNIYGGTVGDDFRANSGSEVNIYGGTVGLRLVAGEVGGDGDTAVVNIAGGMVGGVVVENGIVNMSAGMVLAEAGVDYFAVFRDGVFNLSGGSVGVDGQSGISVTRNGVLNMSAGAATRIDVGNFAGTETARVNITGGDVGLVDQSARSVVNIAGGTIDTVQALSGAVVNYSGGGMSGEGAGFRALAGSTLNIYGTEFLQGGVPITGLELGVPLTIVDRSGQVTGTLVDGTAFSFSPTSSDPNFWHASAVLTVTLVLAGDFNNDGAIDAADYTVWRNNLGAEGLTPYTGGDGNGDGRVTDEDYVVWKSRFHTTPAQLGGQSPTVPEPGSAVLLVLGGVLFARRDCRPRGYSTGK